MNREYIDISENSQFIKGRIDFADNLRQNHVRCDRHIISYQSFEHDNLINNVIKTVGERLLSLTRDSANKKNLKKALIFLDDASNISLSRELIDSAKFTRLNMQFRPVFEMAKMFFLNLSPESYNGEDAVCSFLVPLNELFEYYVYRLFDGIGDGYHAGYQNHRPFVIGADGQSKISIRPDVLLYHDKKLVLIADAKYKNPRFEASGYTAINQADIYQVFAYAGAYGVSDVALVYPQFDNSPPAHQSFLLKNSTGDVRLTIGCVDIRDAHLDIARKRLRETLLQ